MPLIDAIVRASAPNLVPWLPLIADVIGADVPTTDEVEALDETFRADRLRSAVAELIIVRLVGPGGHRLRRRPLDRRVVASLGRGADHSPRRRDDARCDAAPRRLVALTGDDDRARPRSTRGGRATAAQRAPGQRASDATLAGSGNRRRAIRCISSSSRVRSRPRPTRSDVAYPETVERLLAARIDQLPVAGRELIRDAAVLGSTMSRSLASRVLDRPDLVAAETWERELGDLVVVDEASVRFRHDLVGVAAYEGLSVRRRRAVHQRAGDVIEAWDDSVPIPDPVSALAFHATWLRPARPHHPLERRGRGSRDRRRGPWRSPSRCCRDVVAAQRQIGVDAAAVCATYRRLAVAAERAGHPESALDALVQAATTGRRHASGR